MKFLVGFFSLQWLRAFDFIPPLAIRLLLAPVLWVSAVDRLGLFTTPDFIWYNPLTWVNTETLQASAAQLDNSIISGVGADVLTLVLGATEAVGAVLLVLGLAVRWIVPFLIAIVVYLAFVTYGIAGFAAEGPKFIMEHGYTTMEHSQFEVYVTYLILLLTLFFMGAGRWFSLDWFIYRRFTRGLNQHESAQYKGVDPFEIDATDEAGVARRRQSTN